MLLYYFSLMTHAAAKISEQDMLRIDNLPSFWIP